MMSILQEVLLEEYDRCKRRQKAWKKALRDPEWQDRRQKAREALRLTNKDMWMLRRALGPFVLFKWRQRVKRDTENKE